MTVMESFFSTVKSELADQGDVVTLRCLIFTGSSQSSAPAGITLVRCGVVT